MKHNAAVLMISGRREILPKTLDLFYNNWNNVLMMLPLGFYMRYLYSSSKYGNSDKV